MLQNGVMPYWALFLLLFCGTGLFGEQDRQLREPTEREAALGAALVSQVRRQTTPLALASVNQYVQNLVSKLADHIPEARSTWTCLVIEDHRGGSTHEPLSVPGGYLFISAQLILAAENEGELAGMLAHSMTHIVERHAFRQATHGEIAQLANVPVIFMGGPSVWGRDDENLLVSATFLKMQRQQELDADGGAVELMAAAGYDPQAMLGYIRRVQAEISSQRQSFSTLPPRSVRINYLEQMMAGLRASDSFMLDNSFFHSIQDQVRNSLPRPSMPERTRRIPSLMHPDR